MKLLEGSLLAAQRAFFYLARVDSLHVALACRSHASAGSY